MVLPLCLPSVSYNYATRAWSLRFNSPQLDLFRFEAPSYQHVKSPQRLVSLRRQGTSAARTAPNVKTHRVAVTRQGDEFSIGHNFIRWHFYYLPETVCSSFAYRTQDLHVVGDIRFPTATTFLISILNSTSRLFLPCLVQP